MNLKTAFIDSLLTFGGQFLGITIAVLKCSVQKGFTLRFSTDILS